MKKLRLVLLFVTGMILSYCSATKVRNTDCQENMDFKKEFFRNISIVDNNIKGSAQSYEAALAFLSKYSVVDFASMAQYRIHYPFESYTKDRKGWLDWYEQNKCNNIQFKA